MDLKKFESLRSRVSELKREQARAEGALEQTMKRLENQFGCKSLRKAEAILDSKKEELEEIRKEYEVAMREFEDQYGGLLK